MKIDKKKILEAEKILLGWIQDDIEFGYDADNIKDTDFWKELNKGDKMLIRKGLSKKGEK